jgi:hypothetical protein
MEEYNFVIKHVCNALRISPSELSEDRADYAIKLFKLLDRNSFKGINMNEIGNIIGDILATEINKKFGIIDNTFDMHDLQLKMLSTEKVINMEDANTEKTIEAPKIVDVTSILGIKSANEFKMYINPESMYSYHYLVLDSNYRNTALEISNNITKFTWNYAPTQNTGTGYCNSVGAIRDVIGIRVYQPRIPYLTAMNNSAKRVSMLIEEFAAQAFIASNGRRFHYLFRPRFIHPTISAMTDIELSTEDHNDSIFNFRKPINNFSTVTISFGDPNNVLTFATPFTRFIIPFEIICLKSNI